MSFSKSSENPRLVQGRFLAAMCPADIGFRKISMLDLAGYIGNDDGKLAWADQGFFINDTEDVELVDKHILKGKCKNKNGELQDSTIDLDEKICNFDGNLICDNT